VSPAGVKRRYHSCSSLANRIERREPRPVGGYRNQYSAFVAATTRRASANAAQRAGSATEGGDEHGGVKSALTNSRSSLANRSGGENLDAFAGYSLTEV